MDKYINDINEFESKMHTLSLWNKILLGISPPTPDNFVSYLKISNLGYLIFHYFFHPSCRRDYIQNMNSTLF